MGRCRRMTGRCPTRCLPRCATWRARSTSPWAAGYDAVNYGGSIRKAIKAAGGDGWFPPFSDCTPENVAEAKALGLKVGAWTVDEPADMKRLVDLGLDVILHGQTHTAKIA